MLVGLEKDFVKIEGVCGNVVWNEVGVMVWVWVCGECGCGGGGVKDRVGGLVWFGFVCFFLCVWILLLFIG